MKQDNKDSLKTCNKFLTFLKGKPEYKHTYKIFMNVRKDLIKQKKSA